MNSTVNTVSLITTCRRLLTSLETDEARAAVAACNIWLEEQGRSNRLSRLTSHPVPELLQAVLWHVPTEDQKKTYASCSLVNTSWRQAAWSLFWKEVKLSPKFPARKLLHPQIVKFMGRNMRSLKIGQLPWQESPHYVKWSDLPPSFTPTMTKLRMIDLGDASITVECVLSLFRNAPDLISLRAEVISERMRLVNEESGIEVTEGDDFGNDVRRMGYLEKYCPPGSEHIWKEGLGKLKALNISVRGHPLDTAYDLALNISMQEHPQDTSYDLVMDLADGLGRNLESVGVYIGGTESRSAMDYIIRKVTSNCPNLKDVTVGTRGDMASVRRLLHSRPPLQYLSLSGGLSDEIIKVIVYTCTTLKFLSVDCRGLPRGSFRQLAQGPFLRGCQIHSWDVEMDQNDLHEFFKQRGHTLESLSLEYYFPWGSSETPADGVLDCLAEYAANLRVLHMTYVSEESVLKFMHASRNLKRLCLDEKLMASSSIQVAAAEKNVSFSDPDSFEGFGIPYTFGGPPYPTYVEVMKARWIGM